MDWTHLAVAVGEALLAGGYLRRHKKKAKKREEDAAAIARAAARKAAEEAARLALEELERRVEEVTAEWERSLAKLSPDTAGGALLTRLQLQQKVALERGKLEAMRVHREKMQE